MAAIREDLGGVVHVYVDGEAVFLGAGEEVPGGVRVREDVLAGSGDVVSDDVDQVADADSDDGVAEEVSTVDADDDAAADDEDLPADTDSREVWNTYAESVGFDPSPYSKKESLIEALKQR